LAAERARYEAERAERQYRAVEPENRLVARGLETEWEKRLRDLAAAEAELERRERQRPRMLSEAEKKKIFSLGSDLQKVWTAPSTTDRDRKELTLWPARSPSRLATLYIESSDSFVASAAASIATGWSEPVPGREFHPLESSALHGALLRQCCWTAR